jgi:PncC family amidohydrolase
VGVEIAEGVSNCTVWLAHLSSFLPLVSFLLLDHAGSWQSYAMNDLAMLAAAPAALLLQARQTVAVSESSAGGLISAALLAIPGASAYYQGGGVIYTQGARRTLLAIPDEGVKGMRSSTEPFALLAARTIREHLGTTWGLSETGASGPTGNRYGDAAGHACIAVSGPIERVITIETRSADREANMWAFTGAALDLLSECLREAAAAQR